MLNRLKNLFPRRGNGVAIELGSERINIAQLQKKGADLTLKHLCFAEVPEGIFEEGRIINPQELGELIRTTLSDNKIKATLSRNCNRSKILKKYLILIIQVLFCRSERSERICITHSKSMSYTDSFAALRMTKP